MFDRLGNVVARFWPLLLVVWIALAAFLIGVAPKWDDVVQDGEFAYLPESSPSLRAEELFREAFPADLLRSSVVLVVRRETREAGLFESDEYWIENVLTPRLQRIQPLTDLADRFAVDESRREERYLELVTALDSLPATESESGDLPIVSESMKLAAVRDWHADVFGVPEDPDPETKAGDSLGMRLARQAAEAGIANVPKAASFDKRLSLPKVFEKIPPGEDGGSLPKPVITEVRDASDRSIGGLLRSDDGQASLVLVGLTTEFMENRNKIVIDKIDAILDRLRHVRTPDALRMPVGLHVALSGTATVGRDMREAARRSADNTEAATIILVVFLLLAIYRAPVLALIPLVTVAVAVEIALSLLAMLAEVGVVGLFSGIEVYVTVVLYGAGVDYCLFLIARYKEELDRGCTIEEAISESLGKVGAALTASAGTVMCGIGMMVFAQFGKFQEAGVAMASSLFVVLLAALTFTPPLLRLAGRWAFWPRMRTERVAAPGWISPTHLMSRLLEPGWARNIWERVGRALLARPGTIWLTSIGLMLPFAVIGVVWYNYLSYGLLSELPATSPSVVGARAVQEHFPAGTAGPVTVLVRDPRIDFRTQPGKNFVEAITAKLALHRDDLEIADIRSVTHPLGLQGFKGMSGTRQAYIRRRSPEHYVSSTAEHEGHVTRIDVVFEEDPFSRDSIAQLSRFETAVSQAVRNSQARTSEEHPDASEPATTELFYLGPTASLRDLKNVTDIDQIRIDILVLAGVFAILVILLRRPAISAYLILSVFFSYLVTLGMTFAVFWLIDPQFAGLDWKVPMFLFTILIAVGEDYNIFLMTRIHEEQEEHGAVAGVIAALARTGQIISSCGIIMAGTFSSLFVPTLVRWMLLQFGWGTMASGIGIEPAPTSMLQLGFALAFGVLLDTFVVRPILVPAYLVLLYEGKFGPLGRFLGAGDDLPAQKKPTDGGPSA